MVETTDYSNLSHGLNIHVIGRPNMSDDLKNMPDSYWKERLTPEQYSVVRKRGTEAPGSGIYLNSHDDGMYRCVACGQELFTSDTKFESSMPGLTGWPAFYAEAAQGRVELREDKSMFTTRTEVTCARCGAHLGHLFADDPAVKDKGGQHYCINSCALTFQAKKPQAEV
jgi:peptide-methionine (R)-S-oxide reductase